MYFTLSVFNVIWRKVIWDGRGLRVSCAPRVRIAILILYLY